MNQLKKRLIFLIILPAISSLIIFTLFNLPSAPDDTELELYFRAVSAYERGDFTLSISLTDALLTGNRSFYQAGLLNAKALFFSDRYDDAEKCLSKLIKRNKNYYEAEIWYLRTLVQQGNTDKAYKTGIELHSRAPEDPRIAGLLGRLALVENNYQGAIEYYKRAILFEEELAINRIELGKIYSSLFQPDMAELHLKKAITLLSDNSPLQSAIISLLSKNGDSTK